MQDHKEIENWIKREKSHEDFIPWLLKKAHIIIKKSSSAAAGNHIDTEIAIAKQLQKDKEILRPFEKTEKSLDLIKIYTQQLQEDQFKRLKSRWSSHRNRQGNKNISCSIDLKAYEKLEKIKGKHSLKETIETMIALIYNRQTASPLNKYEKSRTTTTPLLDEFRSVESAELGLSPQKSHSFVSLQLDTNTMQHEITEHQKSIDSLLERVYLLEEAQRTSKYRLQN